MSWSTSAIVDDGNTSDLEDAFAANYSDSNASVQEQFEFVLNTIHEAFDAGVVDGLYSVSCSGHSDPEQENDRKYIALSLNPTSAPATAAEPEADN